MNHGRGLNRAPPVQYHLSTESVVFIVANRMLIGATTLLLCLIVFNTRAQGLDPEPAGRLFVLAFPDVVTNTFDS